jgi:hypothetical protein
MAQVRLPSQEPYREEVLELFNLVLCKTAASDRFWQAEMLAELQRKFPNVLSQQVCISISDCEDLCNDLAFPFRRRENAQMWRR